MLGSLGKVKALILLGAVFALAAAMACGSETVKEVVKEVPVDRVVTQEVVKEVPVETIVTQEVVKEVPKEVVVEKEVVRTEVVEVPKEVLVTTEVIKEVPVDRVVEVPADNLDPLIIGQLNAFTGSLSYFGTSHRNGAALAADHINRGGGIQGAPVVIISRDTGVNPVQGVDAARALVDVENAVAIVGALASGVTIPVAQSVTVPKKRVQISGASTSPGITVLEDDDFLFRTVVSDAAQGVVLARLAQEQGYETAGVMFINNAYGQGLADQFEATFTELGGSVTGMVAHEDTQPTYTSELERATEGDPDVLVAISYPGQAETYLRESLEGGYSDSFLFVDGTKSEDMNEVIGWDVLDGTYGTAPGAPDSPQRAAFTAAYADAYAVEIPSDPFIAETYDAVVLIALAAAAAGNTTDAEAIRDALRSVANAPGEVVEPGPDGIKKALILLANGEDINYEGASGPVEIDGNGDVSAPIEIWQIDSGEIKSTGRFELP